MIKVRTTRSNQITTKCHSLIGILVARMHGTSAEKKMMADTATTPMTNFSVRLEAVSYTHLTLPTKA